MNDLKQTIIKAWNQEIIESPDKDDWDTSYLKTLTVKELAIGISGIPVMLFSVLINTFQVLAIGVYTGLVAVGQIFLHGFKFLKSKLPTF